MIVLWIIIGCAMILAIPVQYILDWTHRTDDSDHEFHIRISWLFGLVGFRVRQTIGGAPEKIVWGFGFEKPVKDKKSKQVEEGKEEEVEEKKRKKPLQTARKGYRKFSRYFGMDKLKYILAKGLRLVWRTIRPDTGACHVEIGTGNPMYTGMIIGFLHSMRGLRHYDVSITPNFIRKTITGQCNIRGSIVIGLTIVRFFTFLLTIIFIGIRRRIDVIFAGKTGMFSFSK